MDIEYLINLVTLPNSSSYFTIYSDFLFIIINCSTKITGANVKIESTVILTLL